MTVHAEKDEVSRQAGKATFTQRFAVYPFRFRIELIQIVQRVFVGPAIDLIFQFGREFRGKSTTRSVREIPLDEDFGTRNSGGIIVRFAAARVRRQRRRHLD